MVLHTKNERRDASSMSFEGAGIGGKARLAVTGIARASRPAFRAAADDEPLQQPPIEADIELLRPAHAHDVVLVLAPQADFDRVLAVDRKVMADGEAAAGSERQIFTLPIVLDDV